MGSLLIRGGTLVQTRKDVDVPLRGAEMSQLPLFDNGFVFAEDGVITAIGALSDAPERADVVVDGTGRFILPCWCDSHTHLVFAKSREEEFVMRIRGMSYEQIAAEGGGILNSARRLQDVSEDVLFEDALARLHEVMSFGTGAIEIKSGYGLTTESELKMLRVIRRLREISPIPVRSTFLGAHAIPAEYNHNREGYIKLLIDEMIPRVVNEGLAEYIDVFCDRGFFEIDEMDRILNAGIAAGLKPKIHVSEIANVGGVQSGIRHGAVSVDHLECAGRDEIDALHLSSTIATLLPSCAFFLNLNYAPARALIDAGAAIALATDYNPGSTPSGNMPFVLSLACIKMRLLPEEAINAATINGACAMEFHDIAGTLAPGMRANIIITHPMSSLAYLPYAFGSNHIAQVLINGTAV